MLVFMPFEIAVEIFFKVTGYYLLINIHDTYYRSFLRIGTSYSNAIQAS